MKKPHAKPFIKWVGGKSQLLEQFEKYYPKELKKGSIQHYVEPFLGGGALFFQLSRCYHIETAYLSDMNADLILTYQIVKQKPQELLEILAQYQKIYNETAQEKRNELFLSVRSEFNSNRLYIDYNELSDVWLARAGQFIFLNKTCFNGLFRLNSKGGFNVPYGKYKTATIFDKANILSASKALQNAELHCGDYKDCWEYVGKDSFVYFDPPYRPISDTASFTTYTGKEFDDKAQLKLAKFFQKLDKERGAKLMLSNSDPKNGNPHDDFFEKAYEGYNIFRVSAGRAINCNGDKRGKITELLITNYLYESQALELNF